MSNNTILTQNESKLVVEWLRKDHRVSIDRLTEFWRQRPTTVADRVKREFQIAITVEEINEAARRNLD